jgi:hypothetical protein
MFHRYIYFKAPVSETELIRHAWRAILKLRELDEQATDRLAFKHELQQRIETRDGMVTWMDVLTNFESVEALDRYQLQIGRNHSRIFSAMWRPLKHVCNRLAMDA